MSNDINPLTGQAFTNEEVGELSNLCQLQIAEENKVSALEEELKEAKERLRSIRDDQIPTLMSQLGVSELKLQDGAKVSINKFYAASIPKNNSQANRFFAWLEDNDLDGIIKTEVKAKFQKGEYEKAQSALEALADIAPGATLGRNIHPQTLKAFVRERFESGEGLPTDLINVHIGNTTKIKR